MLKNREKFVIRTVGDKFYLLYVDKNVKYNAPMELNETGEFIVRSLLEDMSIDEIAQKLAGEFELDVAEVVGDIRAFVSSMPEYFIVEE